MWYIRMSEPASDQLNSSRGISITISKETTENKAEHCREYIEYMERYYDDGGSTRCGFVEVAAAYFFSCLYCVYTF